MRRYSNCVHARTLIITFLTAILGIVFIGYLWDQNIAAPDLSGIPTSTPVTATSSLPLSPSTTTAATSSATSTR